MCDLKNTETVSVLLKLDGQVCWINLKERRKWEFVVEQAWKTDIGVSWVLLKNL